jgi:hypothetical protein
MNANYRAIRSIVQIHLSLRADPTKPRLISEDIRDEVARVLEMTGATDVDVEQMVADLEAMFATVIGDGRLLAEDDGAWEPWLLKRKTDIEWRFWERYRHHLVAEEGWAPATIQKLDETTDEVLGRLTAPDKADPWDRRGMVVGDVQSGKTANYIGLTCKAADAGYKLIIVLAGFHNSLRSQTQIRLEEGFLGYDWGASAGGPDATVQRVGVGLQDFTFRADTITNRSDNGDFRRQVANNFAISPGGRPLLFVVKKNSSVLRNLLTWVRGAATAGGDTLVKGIPLLVIDDEADQGSVDTGAQAFDEDGKPDPDHDPRPINRHIRRLLHVFEQSAYVGYTATPFANILIHEDATTAGEGEDLFPRSFIYSLPTPSNHVGPSVVFGYEADDGRVEQGLPIVRSITDQAAGADDEHARWMPPKHKKEHVPLTDGALEVPPSLREAIHAFVLVCAARAARGQHVNHNSMLVHVTRFTAVQRLVADQVLSEVKTLERRLRHGEGDARGARQALRAMWDRDFVPTTRTVVDRGFEAPTALQHWDEVEPRLAAAVSSIKVRQINGLAGEVLDYVEHKDTGLNVIAVGGDKLSRGLTLEGLSVSYFLRASRMYDTLMQMGRWFGYRHGYLDLCRLYTTTEMAEWFSHIADASDELRRDFDRMVASGSTPRDFGQRVRSHPVLMVTSRVKMRHGRTIDLTYDGDISETINFWRDGQHLSDNWDATRGLVQALESAHGPAIQARNRSTAWMWNDADPELILSFLKAYTEHEASKRVKTSLLADYIQRESSANRLRTWTVAIATGDGRQEENLSSHPFKLVKRSWHENTSGDIEELKRQNHYRIRRLLNPPDEAADLSESEFQEACEATIKEWEINPWSRSDPPVRRKRPSIPSGPSIRAARPAERGLLLLYPLDGAEFGKVDSGAGTIPVVGFGISFPKVRGDIASKVRYTVNNVYYRQEVLGMTQDPDW